MSLPADSFERADAIFEAALDLPPEERPAFLAESCGDDPELHALLQRLLAGTEDERTDGERTEPLLAGGAFLGPFGAALRRELSGNDAPLAAGARIGRYRVLRELGPEIQWVHSYVTDDKIYCIYRAPNAELIREHAAKGGFPANSVQEVRSVIDPTTAE